MRRPKDTDSYLAALSEEQRAALAKLRRDLKAAAPDATGLPVAARGAIRQ